MKKFIFVLLTLSVVSMNASYAACDVGDIEVNCTIHQYIDGNYSVPSESFRNCMATSAIATYERTNSRFKVNAGTKFISSSPGNSQAFIALEDMQNKVRISTVVAFNIKAKNKLDRRFSTEYRSWDDKVAVQVYCDARLIQ